MLNKLKKPKSEGFTIIEVMIVLAIAGLILLIVFLAIPALQRSSRNTGRKNDAGRIASAISNFVSNNNGTLPSTTADVSTIVNDAGKLSEYQGLTAGTGNMAQGHINIENNVVAAAPTIAISGTSPTDAIEIDTAAACGTSGATVAGPSARAIALLYTIEPGSGTNYTVACQDI